MNRDARFALTWFIILYVLNTFIGPLIGVNNIQITVGYALINLLIWGGAGLLVYYIKRRQHRKNSENEKMG